MEKLEILQDKYQDLLNEHKQLQRDYILAIKSNMELKKDLIRIKNLLKPRQDKSLPGQIELPIGGK